MKLRRLTLPDHFDHKYQKQKEKNSADASDHIVRDQGFICRKIVCGLEGFLAPGDSGGVLRLYILENGGSYLDAMIEILTAYPVFPFCVGHLNIRLRGGGRDDYRTAGLRLKSFSPRESFWKLLKP